MGLLARYTHWLHTRWPAGTVEKLPEVRSDGTTAIPGVRIVGDLTGIPLLKFASDTGARAVQEILREPEFQASRSEQGDVLDLGIIGGGVSGIAAALEARKAGLAFRVFEAAEPFSTVVNFPREKPIYTYPSEMKPAGDLQFEARVHPKEELLERLEERRRAAGVEVTLSRIERIERRGNLLLLHHGGGQTVTSCRRAIVAIGRSGDHRRLNVPGEEMDRVFNRLYDPAEFSGEPVVVVGGGDSALETSVALASSGARVTLSYRGKEFTRPKRENVEKVSALVENPAAPVAIERPSSERVTAATGAFMRKKPHHPGSLRLAFGTQVVRIERNSVLLRDESGAESAVEASAVFTMLGREAPLEFFRRSGIPIRGEWRARTWAAFLGFLLFCIFLYSWKAGGPLTQFFERRGLFPFNIAPGSALRLSLREPGFYYSLAYCLCVLLFGIRRVRRRKTPYAARQTAVLIAIQWIPLFLLPYVVLPWMGQTGYFDAGFGKALADHLFPAVSYGQGREYWRAFGLILAWPLFVWNIFSAQPLGWWLAISFVQTFVLIPLAIRRWGKGAYCGWICSCGALAETMGDAERQKMPHGPLWNRLNMTGQVLLAAAFLLFAARVVSWSWPSTPLGGFAGRFFDGLLSGWHLFGAPLNYAHVVDLFLAGIVGVGMYFWFSGRVWCRFACPLAALMHIYGRFSKFRIFADKAKCISCNVCTANCHQGIDVMNFANKGLAMEDPECVRCSACVQMCPTGVLSFGYVGKGGLPVLDKLPASPVQMQESGPPSG
jgi:thioredoxin reductase/ferredoxin